MIVMVSNQIGFRTHYLQGRYGGLGLLLPPHGLNGVFPHLPYALDNGAFSSWKNEEPWMEEKFRKALVYCYEAPRQPRWVVVPDVVTDAEATFRMWDEWAPIVSEKGFSLAFAVQDGMTPEMVNRSNVDPEVIFVGGSTEFKWSTLAAWTDNFPRVHVGRVNGLRDLMRCHKKGVESCDGTGFFRGRRGQLYELITYLRECGEGIEDHPLFHPTDEELLQNLFSERGARSI